MAAPPRCAETIERTVEELGHRQLRRRPEMINSRFRHGKRRSSRLPLLLALGVATLAGLVSLRLLATPHPQANDPTPALPATSRPSLTTAEGPAFEPPVGTVPPPISPIGSAPVARPALAPMPTPVSVPRSTRYSPIPLVPDPELAALVTERLAGHSGKFGVAIKDLETGRGVLIDPDGEYQAASLFKLWVMYEVFKQRELGAVSFGEALVLTDRHVSYDLGTLDRPVGSTIELGEALERMITISDNSSAILLTDRVGALNINQDLRGLGLAHTRLFLDDLVTSPLDALVFLEMLARGEGVSPRASAEMLQLLSRQRVNDRIPRLLPPGTIVAHKTGNLAGVINDVGVVYAPGVAFIIAVLTDQATDEAKAAGATAALAATAYEHFQAVGQGGTAVRFPAGEPIPTAPPVPRTPPPAPTPARSELRPAITEPPPQPLDPEPTMARGPAASPAPGLATPAPSATPTPLPGLTPAPGQTIQPTHSTVVPPAPPSRTPAGPARRRSTVAP